MNESDDEIEYLEEDAEIVQQCLEIAQASISTTRVTASKSSPVITERSPTPEKRKRKEEEEDSDYYPDEDMIPLSPPVITRKRKQPPKKVKTSTVPNLKSKLDIPDLPLRENELKNRKRCSIRIPNYDDPLCLPVRAIKNSNSDLKRLSNWNNVCLEHFKYCDDILKPESGATKKSVRTAVFKNVVNKLTGSVETTIWSKTTVENVDGDKKSEIFQCVLPRYREKKVLNNFILGNRKYQATRNKAEVVLSKENHEDGEALVVYKPQESLSAIYRMNDKRDKATEEQDNLDQDQSKLYIKELSCCKLCASCFQGSWRPVKKTKNKSMVCPICARTYVSVYNLLAHFKSHSVMEVRRYQKIISKMLAQVVEYHYKCRICRQKFSSIKALRRHTQSHQSLEVFTCEVGNHIVNVRVRK